jgi:hypothetical protein
MHPSRAQSRSESSRLALKFNIALLLALFAAALCQAQDIPIGVTYVCSGEHIYIEGCNIRDTSDTSTCMVAHPDHLTSTGLNTYTSVTRGALKKLLPTCTQPSAKELAAAKAFQKKQQDTYNANAQKAEDQLKAATQPPPAYGRPQKPKTPEERAITRCVTSGRLPASCTGNSLLGAFSQMVSQVLPSAAKEPAPGPDMAGVFEGPGKWRLDFIDGGVLVNCSFLSPDQHNYTLEFKNNRTTIVIDTTPKPLVSHSRPTEPSWARARFKSTEWLPPVPPPVDRTRTRVADTPTSMECLSRTDRPHRPRNSTAAASAITAPRTPAALRIPPSRTEQPPAQR